MLEFGLVITPLVVLLLGVTVVGLNLGRSIRGNQVARDAASMYVRGIDFSKEGSKDLLVRLADRLGMTRNGGRGVVIFSKVTWIPQSKCDALELDPCNGDRHVIVQRLVVGNAGLRQSALGTPDPSLLDSKGLVDNYLQEGSAVADLVGLTLHEGEYAYVAESYFQSPDFDMPGFQSGTGVYSRAIF